VAGILLSPIYISYSSLVSHRPALMVEYVDVLDAGDHVLIAVNVKNIGNVEVGRAAVKSSDGGVVCEIGSIPPGGVGGCSGAAPHTSPGRAWAGYIEVSFRDGSAQRYPITRGIGYWLGATPIPMVLGGGGEGGSEGESVIQPGIELSADGYALVVFWGRVVFYNHSCEVIRRLLREG